MMNAFWQNVFRARDVRTNVFRGKHFDKGGGDLDQLNEYELLKKDAAAGDI